MLRDGADEADRLRLLANCGFGQKAAALRGGLGNAIGNANRETIRRRQERLREARRALGRTLAAAAEEHGKAMSLATAAEYALMLNARERVRPSVTTLPSRSRRVTARTPRLPTIWGGPPACGSPSCARAAGKPHPATWCNPSPAAGHERCPGTEAPSGAGAGAACATPALGPG